MGIGGIVDRYLNVLGEAAISQTQEHPAGVLLCWIFETDLHRHRLRCRYKKNYRW